MKTTAGGIVAGSSPFRNQPTVLDVLLSATGHWGRWDLYGSIQVLLLNWLDDPTLGFLTSESCQVLLEKLSRWAHERRGELRDEPADPRVAREPVRDPGNTDLFLENQTKQVNY